MDATKEPRFVGLRKFNIAMGVLHLAQFVLMLSLLSGSTFDVYGSFLRYSPDATPPISTAYDNVLFSLPLGLMVSLFLLASAIAHFSVASPWGYPWYVRNLQKGMNYARWFEYAVSSSIMIVVIAMLCGIFELASLILLFAL
ncbi:MAG: heliorhodopsin HeR, partial [Thermoplasmata archaeon]|nr:heliorhodopsin HeR [Thermoplasmata archaeon]